MSTKRKRGRIVTIKDGVHAGKVAIVYHDDQTTHNDETKVIITLDGKKYATDPSRLTFVGFID